MSNVKQLNPDGSISIPSNFPRTRRGPDSRGIRLLAQEIGRSCCLNQGFITFQDGSAYVYTAPSREEFEAMCASLQRGIMFNRGVRRAVFGFTRGFTPPPDYEVIYEWPPYEGTTPADCLPCVNCTGKNRDISAVTWELTENEAIGAIVGSGTAFSLSGAITGFFGGSVTASPDELCFQPSYSITVDWAVTTDSSFVVLSIFIGGYVVLNDEVVVNGDSGSLTFMVPESENDTEVIIIADDGTTTVDITLSPGSPP